MQRLYSWIGGLSTGLHWVAGASLVLLMLTTVADVLLRNLFNRPIPGTYEMVGLAGGLVIGLALPLTSWRRGHVEVDSFIGRVPRPWRSAIHVVTRLLGIALFAILTWNLVLLGLDLRASGEVTPTLELRFYPILFALAGAALAQTVVFCGQMVQVVRGDYE